MTSQMDDERPRSRVAVISWTIAAASLLLMQLFLLVFAVAMKEAVDQGRVTERAFKEAAGYIADHPPQPGELPREDVLYQVTASIHLPDGARYSERIIPMRAKGLYEDLCGADPESKLGRPPPGAYYLAREFDGCWEYYAPWSGESTLGVTGRFWLDEVLYFTVLILLVALCNYGAGKAWRAARRAYG